MKKIELLVVAVALCAAVAWPFANPVFAQSGNAWHVQYFSNLDWTGSPVFAQDLSNLNLNWNGGSPGPGVPAQNFTAIMTTAAGFNTDVYQFSVLADDEVYVLIDSAPVLNTLGQGLSGQNRVFQVAMTAGTHQITVYFRQYTLSAYVYMNWAPLASVPPLLLPQTGTSSGVPAPVTPFPAGLPASAGSVVTAFGDYTRCIQQGLQQANCFVPNPENSPNLGSIQLEPQIQVWGNCTPDQTTSVLISSDGTTRDYKCSKTGAGWFPS